MFAKQAQIAIAALTLSIAGGAFAQSADRNLFDTEAALKPPASASAIGLTREAVRAEFLANRAAHTVASFSPDSYGSDGVNTGAGQAIYALIQHGERSQPVALTSVRSREEVRAEVLAARANGELNPFDTETDLRVEQAVARRQAATAVAKR